MKRSRQLNAQREAKRAMRELAWADVSEDEIDTSDECVDQDDFDGEQYEDDRRNDR